MKKIVAIVAFVFLTSLAGVIVKTGLKSTNFSESRKTYVSGCTANGASESRCQCSFDKIIEKYGYEEYIRLTKELGSVGMEGVKTNLKLSQLVSFMTVDIPKICSN
ncbi:MAG: hypothetical protein UX21_C0024G0006 [Microgenomates group bacterium GW2011_GWC2_45_8]|nr:MAG: hypothetical protein UX21_C0024G0006 [Microgenomates group bacterium GW2011_GWC2_45_8]